MRWALIKNNIVVNVIEADKKFADSIKKNYDFVIQEPLELDSGSMGDVYDPQSDTFQRQNLDAQG